jgi:hypothetical protein
LKDKMAYNLACFSINIMNYSNCELGKLMPNKQTAEH